MQIARSGYGLGNFVKRLIANEMAKTVTECYSSAFSAATFSAAGFRAAAGFLAAAGFFSVAGFLAAAGFFAAAAGFSSLFSASSFVFPMLLSSSKRASNCFKKLSLV